MVPTSRKGQPSRLTIGVLGGWQLFEGNVHTYLGPLFAAIGEAAVERGANVLLASGMGRGEMFLRPAWFSGASGTDFVPVGPWNTDGLIVIAPLASEQLSGDMHAVAASGHPVVHLGAGEGKPRVRMDNAGGITAAVEHLVAHSHRRIAFIGAGPTETAGDNYERLIAYRDAVRRYSLADDPALIEPGWNAESGALAMQSFLDHGVEFTGLIATNDEVATAALGVLLEAKRSTAGIAVIGFDDRPESVTLLPALTTVRVRVADLASEAVDMLVGLIEGTVSPTEERTVLAELRVRESCGCRPHPWSSLPIAVEETTPDGSDVDVTERELIAAMQNAVVNETGDRDADALELCERLGHELRLALQRDDPFARRSALRETVLAFPTLDRDAIWHGLLDVLDARIATLNRAVGRRPEDSAGRELLREIRLLLAESMRRRLFEQAWVRNRTADRIRLMAEQLLSADDEEAVAGIVQRQLAAFDIDDLAVFLLEAKDDDRYASARRIESHPADCSPARTFPGALLPDLDQPYRLVLMPLHLDACNGYISFDSRDLETCALITRSVSASLRGIELRRAMAGAREAAEHAERLKGELLAATSVELQALDRQAEPSPWLTDLVELAHANGSTLALDRAPVALNELLRSVAASTGYTALELDLPPTSPIVHADEARLRRSVLALVRRASAHTPSAPILLRCEESTGVATVSIEVTDDARSGPRPVAHEGGSGELAVLVARRLIELHGAELHELSDALHFDFALPVLTEGLDEPHPLAAPPRIERGPTILLVDDDIESLEIYRNIIASAIQPSRTLRARSGEGALELLAAEPVDLMLLDFVLPDMTAARFFYEKRKLPALRAVPAIAVTSRVLEGPEVSAGGDDLVGLLPKGLFTPSEIAQAVERVLADSRHPSPAQEIVNRACAYIHAHYADPISRTEIARQIGASNGYLSRCFHGQLSLSPMSYLQRYRLTLAKRLLVETNRSVTQIALDVGFNDHAYFSRAFRREAGVAPSAYRMQPEGLRRTESI